MLTDKQLKQENIHYQGSNGVSQQNHCSGFTPAFCDVHTGRTELSRFSNGNLAPLHLIEGLPKEWVEKRDALGNVMAIKASVIAGFIKQGCFYTREEAIADVAC
ncbi:MAG: hypothetical protein V3V50_08305 [Gammaproteobacteria bacterium]